MRAHRRAQSARPQGMSLANLLREAKGGACPEWHKVKPNFDFSDDFKSEFIHVYPCKNSFLVAYLCAIRACPPLLRSYDMRLISSWNSGENASPSRHCRKRVRGLIQDQGFDLNISKSLAV